MFEVSLPARRVFAVAIAAVARPIEHRFDALPHPAGGFRFAPPQALFVIIRCAADRLHEYVEHEPHVDCLHRQLADNRIGVVAERVGPLAGVLRIRLFDLARVDIGPGALLKGHRLRALEPCLLLFRAARLDRIDPVASQLAALARRLARLLQRDGVQGT